MDINNLYDSLAQTAARLPDKIGIADEEERLSYRDLLRRVDNLASYLTEVLKIKRGSRIGMLMQNSNWYVAMVYASAKIGAQLVLINVKLHAKEIAFILEDTEAEYLVLQAKMWERISLEIKHTKVKNLILDLNIVCEHMENYRIFNLPEGGSYHAADYSSVEAAFQTKTMPEEVMAILYTSGTSGVPKGVEIRHRAILETVYSYASILKLDEHQSTLLAVPLFHVTGFSCIMAVFIYIGGYLRMIPSFRSRRSLEIMTDERIRHFHAVPTIYQMLVNVMDEKYDLGALESAVCGGGYIEDRLIGQFSAMAKNVSFHPAYGMTETAGGGVLFPESYMESTRRGSAGKVMDNCAITIFDEQGCELPNGEVGQIAFSGPMIIDHYLNDVGKQNFIGKWLLSGDVGSLDADHYIYVAGRIKSMVNRGGEKIYSRFVEQKICDYPKVNQCMVFPVKDFLFGEVPGCVIVANKGNVITEEEIRDFLKSRIREAEIPQYIEFWDKLPSTASGKVKVAYLTQLFSEKYYVEEEKKK